LKITDRKKEIFKTSGGKYVAPQPIENKLVESPFIEQVMVVGAGEKFAGALIVPSFTVLVDWAKGQNIETTDHEALVQHPKVKEQFKSIVDEMNKNFNQVEQIKKFELLSTPFTLENGEITPGLGKLRRKVIMERRADAVQRIYN
jgi:long-chain acyl-CoA synthetase